MAIKRKDSNGNWVLDQQAIETSIIDLEGNFESTNVEGALRELAEQQKSGANLTELEDKIETNRLGIISNANKIANLQKQIENGGSVPRDLVDRVTTLENEMITAKEDIEYLKVNGGGGGSSAVPTIKSDFEDCAIDKGSDVIIPIFFTSPNMGDGTAYILVNNIQVDSAGVKQGNNNVRVKAQYLSNTDNKVAIYVKDRAGIVTNQLSWTIIAGGIELTSTFDYEVDYGITDTIRIPYTIDTGISGNATLYFTIDNETTEYTCSNGVNYLDINASDIGLGTHAVSMYATIDKYTSRTLSFNIVIISTTELYLSSTFVSGSEYTYGELVSINYRLSKQSTEEFNVYLKLDDVVKKTQKLTVGSYFWTLTSLPVGTHKITIQVVSLDYSEDKSIDLEVVIVEGEYVPVEEYKLGLLCDLNAVGRNNDDDAVINRNLWIDSSGNGHDGQLVNFNFGTNGFVNDELVCDNDAYVVIPWSPWEENALNGSTFDIIYTPINSGVENCRVIDYTQITDNLSTDEIKPFKGLFADVLRGISSSASSGASAGKVNLDDESGEIHLTWVLDRTNKFMKTYIDGVLCRIMFLTDSGSGVNKFYEDFSLDEYIYLNSTKGENCGTNNIKRFRVYDHALTSEQVLQNHIANITDLDAQKQLYDFNYNNTTLPKMYLNGDITNMTAYQTVPMSIEYISPDEERYGQSFNTGIQNNQVKIQGTSSLQYVRHNYTIYLKDEYGADMYYNPYGAGSVADYVFCLKADYVESSHANNTGCAKFVNDCLYDTKTPMQLDNENCRTAINGFPIEVYMNGEYLGVYNFNHDRYSYMSYGYDYKKYPNMLVYEINSNSNTSAGAFYRYGDNPESSTGVTELEYYKRDFNLIYGNRTTDSDTYSEIKTLVEWVSVAEQDLFRETISEHFNTEYLFRYFLMVLLIGAVDSLGKNMKIMTIDGKVWYPTFYDLDTVLGIDNTGYLTIEPDVEIESGSYNTSNSNLWTKVWNFFRTELQAEWSAMRQGKFTLDNLMDYIYGQQIEVIPAKYYNDDAEVKYLQFGSLYTYCCHGDKRHQIKRWLRERIAYVDSMMGYFTSQEDQVTIRMNKTGYVSFDITTYIPLYFSVKWSNATGGTQTFKMKRGETKTFYYTSTTSTDQEVIVYHAQYIKALDNLSNLNPSSCILANAKKLTNVEIHSTELYNINVTNNTFLRSINLEGCSTLGTVTATGSSLDLSNCKYLRYCNVYNTALTEVQLNTSGGSLIEIYYPKTIQSINLIKQRLLEKIGLPYGSGGDEIPTSLYTISIQECPSIKYLNTSDNSAINTTFASMVYCNNLTIRNSLDLRRLTFDGFYRLKNVVIENMYNLEELGFNDLLPKGDASTLQYIGLSNCPLLEVLELNCTSNEYEITFANKAILNLGGLFGLKSIESNCVLKGIETIVVPLNLESMFFTNEYGEGYSTIKNIWSSSVCTVNTSGSTAKAQHLDPTYEGIDFAGMNLKNIDLGALVNIPKAINFTLYPTTVNPHFNLNRDGETYPYLQPVGTLDLSNYTESLAKFFDGVDLDKLKIVCTNKLPQTDLSYCFYNATFSNDTAINTLLSKVSSITNLDYCFYKTTVADTSILSKISMGESSTMNYTFAECPNITTLKNVTIPSTVIEVEGMFYKCPLKAITNMTVNVNGSISGLFKGCTELTTISTLRIPNVTDVSSTFEGCTSLTTLTGFELPSSCTNVSNLFNGCYMLTSMSMNFGSNIVAGENWYPPNLETLNDTNIESGYVKMTNCSTLKNVNNLYINNGDYSDMFNGCPNLATLTLTMGRNVTGLARFIKGCSEITSKPFTEIPETCTTIEEMFNGTNITDISGMTFGSKITNATNWLPIGLITANNITIKNNNVNFTNCKTLKYCDNLTIINRTTMNNFFSGCTLLQSVENLSIPDTVTSIRNLFYDCSNLKKICLIIPDSVTDIVFLFSKCKALTDISGTVFGSGITNSEMWADGYAVTVPITTANNVTIKNNNVKFKGYSTLIECNNLTFTDEVTTIDNMFNGCKKLSSVENLTLGRYCDNLSMAFDTCTSLERLVIPELPSDRNINFYRTFASCSNLKYLEFYDKVMTVTVSADNINVQTMNDCQNLVTLKNFKVKYADKDVTSDILQTYINTETPALNILSGLYTFFGGCRSLKETPGMGIYNNSARLLFYNFQGDITDFIIGEEVTDISYLFRNKPRLTHDIEIPSHITNCTGCFKNSTKITHIHSNWNNAYTNGITATDCYAGCTGITHIDDENVISYEGDLGLDYIPLGWGGNGFTKDCTTIYEIEITSDYTSTALRPIGVKTLLSLDSSVAKVNWGDGSSAELLVQNGALITHTYTKEGIYYVKAHNVLGRGYGPGFNLVMTKLLQISKYQNGNPYSDLSFACASCGDKLTYADFSNLDVSNSFRTYSMFKNDKNLETVVVPKNMIINYSAEMFMGCGKLTSIVNYETWDMTKCGHAAGMFNGCSSLGNLDVSNWGMGGIFTTIGWGVQYMFNNCKKMTYFDVSKWDTSTWNSCTSLFAGTSIETIDLSNWKPLTKGQDTNKNLDYMFSGCTKLKEIIGLENILDSNIVNLNGVFQNCTLLPPSYLNNLLGSCDLSNIKQMQNTFYGCTQLTELDLSDCYIPKIERLDGLVRNCSNLTTLKFPPVQNYKALFSVQSMLTGTNSLTRVENLPLVNYIVQSKHEGQMTCMLYAYGDRNKIPDNGLTFTFADKITSLWNLWSGVYIPNMFNKFTVETLDNIVKALYDYASDGSTKTLNTNGYISRFTNEQLIIASNKGWTIT